MPTDFAAPWLAFWRLAGAMTWGGLASFARLYDPRAMRAAWSTQMTKSLDRAMRSPEFLDLMAASLSTAASVTRFTSQFRVR